MKRLHVGLTVADLDQSIRFYSGLFATAPTVIKDDYAKWMLDDPRVNLSITARGKAPGIDHLGIQVEDQDELREVRDRLATLDQSVYDQGRAQCCYAESEKSWVRDPQGVPWEMFLTLRPLTGFDDDSAPGDVLAADTEGCCGPAKETEPCCRAVADATVD